MLVYEIRKALTLIMDRPCSCIVAFKMACGVLISWHPMICVLIHILVFDMFSYALMWVPILVSLM